MHIIGSSNGGHGAPLQRAGSRIGLVDVDVSAMPGRGLNEAQTVRTPHGSLERTPGALFSAMGALLLLEKRASSREALARELRERLGALGVDYHVRTLKRQLTGSVSSVPREVEAVMRHLLLCANPLRTDVDIEQALGAAGLSVGQDERQPMYLCTRRIVPLAQAPAPRLWRGRRNASARFSGTTPTHAPLPEPDPWQRVEGKLRYVVLAAAAACAHGSPERIQNEGTQHEHHHLA